MDRNGGISIFSPNVRIYVHGIHVLINDLIKPYSKHLLSINIGVILGASNPLSVIQISNGGGYKLQYLITLSVSVKISFCSLF